ncbi:MAG: hypothetical protein H7067_14050 [Burkholderiales bacterium]|nr:hypothetical protein [Opitutaceae bacterium]
MQALTDFLLPLFLALGCAWFGVDLVKKLRAPAPRTKPAPAPAQIPSTPAQPAAHASSLPLLTGNAGILPASDSDSSSAPALPPAHLAVIAATIHHLFRGRARVVGVAPAATPGPHSSVDWAREGRRDIFSSHRLR